MTPIEDKINDVETHASNGDAEEMEKSLGELYQLCGNNQWDVGRLEETLKGTVVEGYRNAATNALKFLNNSSGYAVRMEGDVLGNAPEYQKKYNRLSNGGKITEIINYGNPGLQKP
jgi:hypothetical protein